MWFPVNAIATVSPAGMYFVSMTSATAGTVYQNTLQSGVPFIPAQSALIPCTTASSYTTVTAVLNQVLTIPIPGNSMGPSGRVRFTGIAANNNSAGAKTAQFTFGGGAIAGIANTTNQSAISQHDVINNGVTNSQVCIGGSGFVAAAPLPPRPLIDTTQTFNIGFTLQLATATDTVEWDFCLVEVFPGN
jgi:hypothetical protein